MNRLALFAALLVCLPAAAQISAACACDPANPESMKQRPCSLCNEAERQPADVEFFVLKDINPRKPNRWLVLPRNHSDGAHHMHHMDRAEVLKLWKFAVKTAQEKFGEEWGLAYNGSKVRTQCHLHIHVGRFIKAAELSGAKTVKRLDDFPAPEEGGVWIHPVKGGYHVHSGEETCETALVR